MSSFSQRIGVIPKYRQLQINSMDSDLKNSIWNVLYHDVFDYVRPDNFGDNGFSRFKNDIVVNFYKQPLQQAATYHKNLIPAISESFDKFTWNRVYDFVEFFIGKEYVRNEFVSDLNHMLEREFSGYRVINDIIVPITNDLEKDSIDEALEHAINFTGYEGINIHLSNALNALSDKDNPNYSNSIKESVSAVETAARLITDEGTLGNALNRLERAGLDINNQLKESFNKIYAFTNDKSSGIRHAVVEQHQPANFETAKYILVTSSAFVNYLISLAQKAGILGESPEAVK